MPINPTIEITQPTHLYSLEETAKIYSALLKALRFAQKDFDQCKGSCGTDAVLSQIKEVCELVASHAPICPEHTDEEKQARFLESMEQERIMGGLD